MKKSNAKKILAIIPARGGSIDIPRKNIKKLCGLPLVSYPIRLARSIRTIDRVIVSSDDSSILTCARRYGGETPFVRPKVLAQDCTPTLPVLQHCVRYLEIHERYRPDYILVLYPTSPLLKKSDLMKALKILVRSRRSCVVSVEKDYGKYWQTVGRSLHCHMFYPQQRVNRQWHKPLYRENGGIYAVDYATLMKNNKLIDPKYTRLHIMNPGVLVDINSMHDWREAQKRLKNA